jgi:hypothetical protein
MAEPGKVVPLLAMVVVRVQRPSPPAEDVQERRLMPGPSSDTIGWHIEVKMPYPQSPITYMCDVVAMI